jgi:hypothetical protein
LAAPSDALAQVERVMLALAVNHSPLFAEIEEDLGTVSFADARLDRLRQGLLQALGRAGQGWTAAEASALLADPELAQTLAEVLAHPLIRSHRLVRPEASLADARATWAENAGLHARLAAEAGAREAVDSEALTLEPETWERLRAKKDAPNQGNEAAE